MDVIFVLVMCGLGAWFARMDGGGWPKTPEILERLLCMSFFVVACIPVAGVIAPLALVGMVGITTGHGQYFLERMQKYIKPETLDFIVSLFFGKDIRTRAKYANGLEGTTFYAEYGDNYNKLYWRNLFGMFVTGTLVGLPAGIIFMVNGLPLMGLLLSLTGVVKSLAYCISWETTRGTELAEWLNGFFRTLLPALIIVQLL